MKRHHWVAALCCAVIVAACVYAFSPELSAAMDAVVQAHLHPTWHTLVAEGAPAVTVAQLKEATDKLKEVTEAFNKKGDDLAKKAEDALKEVKEAGALTAELKASADKMLVEHTTLTAEKNKLEARITEMEQKLARKPGAQSQPEAKQSIGQQVVALDGFKKFAAEATRGKFRHEVKAAITSLDFPNNNPNIIQPMRLPGTVIPPKPRLFVRDLLNVGTTEAPFIAWVKMTGFTNNAAVVSEGTTKPTSNIAYEAKMTPVTTLAHLFKASKQVMMNFAQLASDVDRELRFGLKYEEEQEVLLGDGTGIHLHGIIPQATDYDPAFRADHHTMIDDLRLGMLQSQLARLPASGIVMHFIDWAQIELTKDTVGQYIFANPLRIATQTMWGLPIVASENNALKNKFLTGGFDSAATLYDREVINVEVSTENNDDFEKNMITVRCEEQVALAVQRPEAFIFGEFTTGTNA